MPTQSTTLPPELARRIASAITLARSAYIVNQTAAADRCVPCLVVSVVGWRQAIHNLPPIMRHDSFIQARIIEPAKRELDRAVLNGDDLAHAVQRP